jgi:hypothetical protein
LKRVLEDRVHIHAAIRINKLVGIIISAKTAETVAEATRPVVTTTTEAARLTKVPREAPAAKVAAEEQLHQLMLAAIPFAARF